MTPRGTPGVAAVSPRSGRSLRLGTRLGAGATRFTTKALAAGGALAILMAATPADAHRDRWGGGPGYYYAPPPAYYVPPPPPVYYAPRQYYAPPPVPFYGPPPGAYYYAPPPPVFYAPPRPVAPGFGIGFTFR